MRNKIQKKQIVRPKTRLALPDLDHAKAAVLGSLRSPESQRGYRHAIDEFVGWYGALGNCRSGRQGRTYSDGPVPDWVKQLVDEWLTAAAVNTGRLVRCVCRAGTTWGDGMTEKVVWHVVKTYAEKLGVAKLALHDLRRSCARLCHAAGGELEQIQFGHVSVQTTERYLGCKQRLREAVNGRIGIEPTI